ncbi:MAG: 5-(carboxyamino)imidazole ribonucleotide mutase [Candidatus Stahlbacteria bacterium]|nr:5-(carboxyamino)imidazole ribonucleotide mutase [Candidatus Stahlbacteria bacterium]
MEISIVIGSKSDEKWVEPCKEVLDKANISYEIIISSAHREPEKTRKYAQSLKSKGVKVVIAMAGYAAALPGFIASYTDIPVIGVPLPTSPIKGIDSLLSIAEMPAGVPVATMGIGEAGAKNAALFVCKILGVK